MIVDNSNVGAFKFADEAQMGGLSNLMVNKFKSENNNDEYHANNNMDISQDKSISPNSFQAHFSDVLTFRVFFDLFGTF